MWALCLLLIKRYWLSHWEAEWWISSVPSYDDVIKRKHFPRYWPSVWGIHRSPVNSPHKGQWRGAVMLSLIRAWIKGWVNNREAGDLRCHRAHYDFTIMNIYWMTYVWRVNHLNANVILTFPSLVVPEVTTKTMDENIKMAIFAHQWCIIPRFPQVNDMISLFFRLKSYHALPSLVGFLSFIHRWFPK